MATKPWWIPEINQDVDAEFNFWKTQFVHSAWMAVGVAVVVAFLIAVWPPGDGSSGLREFARDIWPLFVECGFWLGFLVGLLWSAAKRAGSALSGTLPWLPSQKLSARAAASRQFGQWAMFAALAGSLLWISVQFEPLWEARTAPVFTALTMLMQASLASAAVFAVIAIAGRESFAIPSRDVQQSRHRPDD